MRDGKFAEAVDTLVEVVGEEVRQEILSGESPIPKQRVIDLGRQAEREPKQAKERYTRATAGNGRALEPEIVEPERKQRRPTRGRKLPSSCC